MRMSILNTLNNNSYYYYYKKWAGPDWKSIDFYEMKELKED